MVASPEAAAFPWAFIVLVTAMQGTVGVSISQASRGQPQLMACVEEDLMQTQHVPFPSEGQAWAQHTLRLEIPRE